MVPSKEFYLAVIFKNKLEYILPGIHSRLLDEFKTPNFDNVTNKSSANVAIRFAASFAFLITSSSSAAT
jgi:hypothetical protein